MRRSLAQTYISLDYGIEHHIRKMFLQLIQHLRMDLGPAVEHRHHEAFDGQFRIHPVLHKPDSLEQLAQTLQCEELRLHRNNHRIRGSQGIHRNKAQ